MLTDACDVSLHFPQKNSAFPAEYNWTHAMRPYIPKNPRFLQGENLIRFARTPTACVYDFFRFLRFSISHILKKCIFAK